ncbi:MAG TPA: LysM peptidoglycan-binding domain-containing protein [Vicinamibacterales bacterium]|nr:LysM peptidoglycan-binding domain-containing protein [Vicinamibacterales bacterium]
MVEYAPMRKAPEHRKNRAGSVVSFGASAGLTLALCLLGVAASPVYSAAGQSASPAASTPAPQTDAVADLIALSTSHFDRGQKELREGHLEMAKAEFNRSLEVLLESRYGARTDPRIREHFDRLVERISAYELTALAQGDGFTEKKYEPATIDDLLAISTFEQPPATPETKQVVSADLQETPHDIDIPLNAKVLQYVQAFSGRLKGYLEDGLSRGAQYLPMIQEVFRAEGLPLDLAYVPLIESAFKPSALSKAKAKGIWQFMRGTGLENGLQHDWYIDERADPEKATRAAAKYLTTLYGMFGDWHLALASYNGGPGRVQRAMKRSRRDDFWALTSSTRYLPRETRDYVPLILAAIVVARNPAQYGLNIAELEIQRSEQITVANPIDLRKVAEWAGVPVETIQNLNPELRRWTTPVRETDYQLNVPEGTGEQILASMAAADPEELVSFNRHIVKKGETISTIAKKLKVSRTDLAEANYLRTSARLTAGQQLIIPRAPTTMLAARTETPAPVAESRAVDAVVASNVRPPVVQNETAASSTTRVTHRVKRGETLFSIAKLYHTTVAAVKRWNRLTGSAIKAGQRLTILRPDVVATN